MSEEATDVSQESPETPAPAADVAPEVAQEDGFRKGYDRVANPDAPEPQPEPPKAFTAEDARALFAEMSGQTESEIRAQLKKASGKIGGLYQEIERLRSAPKSAGVAFSPDALKRVRESFPEIGEPLAQDLAEIFTVSAPTDKPKASADDETPKLIGTLSELRPGWHEKRQTPEFGEWLQAMKPSARARFESSLDPYFVAERLEDFDDWLASKTTAASAPAPIARLENAVTPTNGTRPPVKTGEPSASESFRKGYQRIASARH